STDLRLRSRFSRAQKEPGVAGERVVRNRSSGIAVAKHLRFPPSYHESAFGGSACGRGARCTHCGRVATTTQCANTCGRGSALVRVEANDPGGARLRPTGE